MSCVAPPYAGVLCPGWQVEAKSEALLSNPLMSALWQTPSLCFPTPVPTSSYRKDVTCDDKNVTAAAAAPESGCSQGWHHEVMVFRGQGRGQGAGGVSEHVVWAPLGAGRVGICSLTSVSSPPPQPLPCACRSVLCKVGIDTCFLDSLGTGSSFPMRCEVMPLGRGCSPLVRSFLQWKLRRNRDP